MPRIPPSLIRKVRAVHPYIAQLLPICRDLHSVHRELRWMRDHANNVLKESSTDVQNRRLHQYVRRRAGGEPLQYILGSEFFGDLEIKCRRGVLIPRQETAASITHLVNLLSSRSKALPKHLRVLDLCTGTGCIPLLFQHLFHHANLRIQTLLDVVGVDISIAALRLAHENKAKQLDGHFLKGWSEITKRGSLASTTFVQADVLRDGLASEKTSTPPLMDALKQSRNGLETPTVFDILISNPPYISGKDYWRTTSPSVRNFEPQRALVPSPGVADSINDGDLFYQRLVKIAYEVDAKILLFEVSDLDQAKRVATLLVQRKCWDGVEIWRDDPAAKSDDFSSSMTEFEHTYGSMSIPILGQGTGRSVIAYRDHGTRWLSWD